MSKGLKSILSLFAIGLSLLSSVSDGCEVSTSSSLHSRDTSAPRNADSLGVCAAEILEDDRIHEPLESTPGHDQDWIKISFRFCSLTLRQFIQQSTPPSLSAPVSIRYHSPRAPPV